ncbi:hypothetical protein D0962_29300 [Leptolyngbyaceae cyanobacterium CCMR0082]|uniref:Uncharacterized protein n=1 Tax=Adonisia turfae CCMR0082 TaxID=2304604 RepID=A0A6M0SEE7_9CYAN|nr:hypothetical protein [Adonisia turfae]NEZ66804.1 hypothetical protein [Adonisia turfae CCMR0082]
MRPESSPNDLFRFVQLRPPISLAENQFIPLVASTNFFTQIQSATTVTERQSIADTYIANNSESGLFVRSPEQLQHGTAIQNSIATTSDADEPSTDLFIVTLTGLLEIADISELANDAAFQQDRVRLSDTLLARMFTTNSLPNLSILQNIYRAYYLIVQTAAEEDIQLSWDRFLRMSIIIPEDALTSVVSLRKAASSEPTVTAVTTQSEDTTIDRKSQLYNAYQELMRCDRNQNLIQPESASVNTEGTNVFALKETVVNSLSTETRAVLESQQIDPENTPIHSIVMDIYTTLQQEASAISSTTVDTNTQPQIARVIRHAELGSTQRDIRPSGVGNLLVVKQQIKRYEPTEVAHIENILSGEEKTREQRELQLVEETFSNVFETTREEQNELETSQRFELNREASRTIQQDQNVNFGVNLSGKYGPYVEFSTNFELETSQSVEETNSNSTSYAQNIVERSLEKIVEHIREERTRRILREVEEKNTHSLTNSGAEHIRGVYQFVDKIYEAQVFDYGIRMMYDFMIPEPASYLHYLRNQPDSELELPDPPPRFTLTSHTQITEANYGSEAAKYGATEIDPPPDPYVLASAAIMNEGGDEGGTPRFAKTKELTIPEEYGPERVEYAAQATTDDDLAITVLIGSRFHRITRSQGGNWPGFPQYISLDSGHYSYPQGTQLSVGVFVFESRTFLVDITIFCKRRPEAYEQWKLKTFQKIQQAYERRVLEYEEKVAAIRAEQALAQAAAEEERSFGAPPSLNRITERNELKKHAISIVTGSRYEFINAVIDGAPPIFDFDEAREEGSLIRFFEQVFEWEQMQYVFYPYFWSRTNTWEDRFTTDNPDPQFREFLKAGAARVVISVRPGFETALQHYLDTGKLWDGQGEPPQITSPLYVSIVDEIKERTGAPQGEILVGEPWDIRVPTNLLYVRANDDLPAWVQNPPGSWQWESTDSEPTPALAIMGLALVDAQTQADIQSIENGDVLSINDMPSMINLRAIADPKYVGSVVLNLNDGQQTRTENTRPYFLYSNNGVQPVLGNYTLSVKAFSKPEGLGIEGRERVVQFSFIE